MINLMFCGNDKIYDGLLISLLSIVKYNKEPLNINVITVDLSDIDEKYTPITEEHRKELEEVIKPYNFIRSNKGQIPDNTFREKELEKPEWYVSEEFKLSEFYTDIMNIYSDIFIALKNNRSNE